MGLAINCDMGEAFGLYRMGDDEGIMPFITVANIACGFHASDPVVMRDTVRLANTLHEEIYGKRGIGFVPEFYVDLDYDGDGGLIITREHVAWDPGEAAARTLRAVTDGVVRSVDGNDVPMRAESLCVHSDTPGAVEVAKAVYETVKAHLN